jgi:hypothetical protein
MATHGTRSAYYQGCRCEECRETARLARARQRATAAGRAGRPRKAQGHLQDRWTLVGVLVGAGVLSLRQAKRFRIDERTAGVPAWPWVVAGVVLLTGAGFVVALTFHESGSD